MAETDLQFRPFDPSTLSKAPPSVPMSGAEELKFEPYQGSAELRPTAPELQTPGVETNPLEQMNIEQQNQKRAMQQHTSPVISAHKQNFLSDRVEQDDTGRWVYIDKGGNFIPLDDAKHVLLQDPADARFKVFARTPETTEGTLAGLGRLAAEGTGANRMLAGAKVLKPAMEAAGNIGARIPWAVISDNPLVRLGAKIVSGLPGGGPLARKIGERQEELGGSLEEAIRRSGGSVNPATAGASFEQGVETGFRPGLKAGYKTLYDRVDAGVDNAVQHQLSNTEHAVDTIEKGRASYGDTWTGDAAKLIRNALDLPGGLNYQAIKNLRTRLGEMLGKVPEGTTKKEMGALYEALSSDLEGAVAKAGSPEALRDFRVATRAYRLGKTWEDKIDAIIGTKSDEGIANALFRKAQAGGSGEDIRSLQAARRAVPASAWKDMTANALSRLGKNAAGDFDPQKFIKDYSSLSDAGKRTLFGGSGSADLVPFLDDIAKVSQEFVKRGKVGGLGEKVVGHGGFGTALALAGEHAFEGNYKPALAVVSSAIGANLAGRLLGAAPSAASMARFSRAWDAYIRKPAPATFASLNMSMRNLANTASDHLGVPADRLYGQLSGALQSQSQGAQ